jgi:type IV secretory pathway protease TraF
MSDPAPGLIPLNEVLPPELDADAAQPGGIGAAAVPPSPPASAPQSEPAGWLEMIVILAQRIEATQQQLSAVERYALALEGCVAQHAKVIDAQSTAIRQLQLRAGLAGWVEQDELDVPTVH